MGYTAHGETARGVIWMLPTKVTPFDHEIILLKRKLSQTKKPANFIWDLSTYEKGKN